MSHRQYTLKGKGKRKRRSSSVSQPSSPVIARDRSPPVTHDRKRSKTHKVLEDSEEEFHGIQNQSSDEHEANSESDTPVYQKASSSKISTSSSSKASSSKTYDPKRAQALNALVNAVKTTAARRGSHHHGAGSSSQVYNKAEHDVKTNLTQKDKGKGKAKAKAPAHAKSGKNDSFSVGSIIFLVNGTRVAAKGEQQVDPKLEYLKIRRFPLETRLPSTHVALRPYVLRKLAVVAEPDGELIGPFKQSWSGDEVEAFLSTQFPDLFEYLKQTHQEYFLCQKICRKICVVPYIEGKPTARDILDTRVPHQSGSHWQLIFATKNEIPKYIHKMWRSSEYDSSSDDNVDETAVKDQPGSSKTVKARRRRAPKEISSDEEEDIMLISTDEEDKDENKDVEEIYNRRSTRFKGKGRAVPSSSDHEEPEKIDDDEDMPLWEAPPSPSPPILLTQPQPSGSTPPSPSPSTVKALSQQLSRDLSLDSPVHFTSSAFKKRTLFW